MVTLLLRVHTTLQKDLWYINSMLTTEHIIDVILQNLLYSQKNENLQKVKGLLYMKKLYAPWRTAYAREIAAQSKQESTTADACVFCTQFTASDDHKNGILRRFTHTIAMLNKYPYNAGHILIVPHAHRATLHELSTPARTELIELASQSQLIMVNTLKAQGVNMGLNLGKAAGAGIPAHLHLHVLPRFLGDTNFMPTLCDTKQISIDLNTIYTQLKPAFDAIEL
jgi:ATP adenylyltransferase